MTTITDPRSFLTHALTRTFSDTKVDLVSSDRDGVRHADFKKHGTEPVTYAIPLTEIITEGEKLITELNKPDTREPTLRAIYTSHGKGEIPMGVQIHAHRLVAWEVETAKYSLGLPYNANP